MIQPDRTRLVVFLLLPALLLSGCGATPAPRSISGTPAGTSHQDILSEPTATQRPGEVNPEDQRTSLVGAILADPAKYLDRAVEVVGYYRGWDLRHETGQAPPVTRSDWVIADASGAIYVTGLMPSGLDPSTQADTQTLLRLFATVEYSEQSQVVYLRAERVELVHE